MMEISDLSRRAGRAFIQKKTRTAAAMAVAAAVVVVAVLAAPRWPGGVAGATSLYDEETSPFASMYADRKASQVGDLITILVTEVSYAQNRSQTNTAQGIGVVAQPGVGPFDFIPAAKLDVGDSSKGASETTRTGRLVGTMTAEVVEVLPNGDLIIRGTREVSVNREKEIMVVEGVIRPQDIGPNNTIPSTMVANAQISLSGGVYTGKKGGFFKTLWDGLVYVWNTIF